MAPHQTRLPYPEGWKNIRHNKNCSYSQRHYLHWLAHEATRKFDLIRTYQLIRLPIPEALRDGAQWAMEEIDRIKDGKGPKHYHREKL
jgi:hypothetical protein